MLLGGEIKCRCNPPLAQTRTAQSSKTRDGGKRRVTRVDRKSGMTKTFRGLLVEQ